jgi:hypothetical protein
MRRNIGCTGQEVITLLSGKTGGVYAAKGIS